MTEIFEEETMGKGILTHLTIIMDGNGRWAENRGLRREIGHRKGAENLRNLCVLCRERAIRYVTVYAFSTENWHRPRSEVNALMRLFAQYFKKYAAEMEREGIRLRFIGERSQLPADVTRTMDEAEQTSKDRTALQLVIAFNYGGRSEIVSAARAIAADSVSGKLAPSDITEDVFAGYLYLPDIPEPEFLIRTGGEYRLSNFLLWQSAYTELYTDDCLWPDFGAQQLDRALEDYSTRQRRFGSIRGETSY
ncbi:MAG: di-trans,poly-cis-decaprenylcistransferase [Clostridiaceae bacterium]|nr:di-trans,poly-cis-decaprenylcistransferase [Clostridiaceae bacterium]